MKRIDKPLECYTLIGVPALDPITVIVDRILPTPERDHWSASITLVCYGRAWNAYFGSMGNPFELFFVRASADYLADKMMTAPLNKKKEPGEKAYLMRIIVAVQESMMT